MNLIPFGLRIADERMVDVSEVANGLACGCDCPSCGVTLIARQGDTKRWHFAHAAQADNTNDVDPCEFSFFVSVRHMAVQLLQGGVEFAVPSCGGAVRSVSADPREDDEERFSVSSETFTRFEHGEIRTDALVDGHRVDLLACSPTAPLDGWLGVVFIYPGRPGHGDPTLPRRIGVVAVDLRPMEREFERGWHTAENFRDRLRLYLETDVRHRSWEFHPAFEGAKARAQAILDARVKLRPRRTQLVAEPAARSSFNVGLPPASAATPSTTETMMKCVMCSTTWSVREHEAWVCPKCRSQGHLYIRPVPSQRR